MRVSFDGLRTKIGMQYNSLANAIDDIVDSPLVVKELNELRMLLANLMICEDKSDKEDCNVVDIELKKIGE